jgi:hypothetical protein
MLVPAAATAGPWLPAPGKLYLELRESFDTTSQGFDSDGNRHRLRTLSDDGLPVATRLYDAHTKIYGEIGLATRLAIVVELDALSVVAMPRAGHSARRAVGLGDLAAGFRLQLLDEEVACAIDARLGIPTGSADDPQPLGTGDLRGEFVLSVGRVFERVPIVVAVELGARLRSSGTQRAQAAGRTATLVDPLDPSSLAKVRIDYSSELVYGLWIGWLGRIGERVRITPRVTVDGRHGFSAPEALPIDPVAPASMRLLRLGAQIAVAVALRGRRPQPAASVHVGLGGGAFVWGQGLPAAGELSLALGFSR